MAERPEEQSTHAKALGSRLTRRTMLRWVGLGSVGAYLAGCGSQPVPTAAPAAPAAPAAAATTAPAAAATTAPAATKPAAAPSPVAKQVTLKFWLTGGTRFEEFYNKDIFPLFYKEYPNIKIETTILGSWTDLYNKLVTAAAGGAPPDFARQKDFFTPDWAMRGIVQELDDWAKAEPHLKADQYLAKPWSNCFWGGKMIAMPLHIFIHYLHYNPALFKEAGVVDASGNPKVPDTWDEMREAAKKLTNPGKKVWGTWLRSYGGQEDTVNFYTVMLAGAGGKFTDDNYSQFLFNSPEGLDALKFQCDMIKEGSMMPPGLPTTNIIEENHVGMWYHSSSYWPGYLRNKPDFQWCTARNPVRKTRAAVIRGNHLVMFKGSKEKEAAWRFLAFHSRPEIDYKYAQVAVYTTPRLDTLKQPMYQGAYNNLPCVQWKHELEGLNDPDDIPQPIFPGYQESSFKIGAQLMEAYMGKKTPEAALAQAEKDGNEVLKMIRSYLGIVSPTATPKK